MATGAKGHLYLKYECACTDPTPIDYSPYLTPTSQQRQTPMQTPQQHYTEELQQLRDMGFTDETAMLQALQVYYHLAACPYSLSF